MSNEKFHQTTIVTEHEFKCFSTKDKYKGVYSGIIESLNDIELHTLFVKEEDRSKGKGSEFVSGLKKYANEVGKPIKATIGVREDTDRMKNFYEKNGFVNTKANDYIYTPSVNA